MLLKTDNRKCVKRDQALIIQDYPYRREEVISGNKSRTGVLFQYVELLFATLAVVKSMTGYSVNTSSGWRLQTTTNLSHAVVWISPIQILIPK